MKSVNPRNAQELMAQGAILVDVRSAQERARMFIPGSVSVPIEALEAGGLPIPAPNGVIFYCRSGNRTQLNAALISACVRGACECPDNLYVLEGGLDAWKHEGLALQVDHSQPLELQRQVQMGAGSLVLVGVLLGALLHPGFYTLAGFVGAGLIFAGLTGFCGLARVLMKAPWNRRAAATVSQ